MRNEKPKPDHLAVVTSGRTAAEHPASGLDLNEILDKAYTDAGNMKEMARRANAYPDLLAALETLVDRELTYFNETVEISYGSMSEAFAAVDNARAAIAKAKGVA